MAEKQTINQSNYGWYKSLEANGRYPIIAKRIFDTYTDAEEFLVDPTAIPGVIIRVVADSNSRENGAYIVLGTLGEQEQHPQLYLEKLTSSSELNWLELNDDSSDDSSDDPSTITFTALYDYDKASSGPTYVESYSINIDQPMTISEFVDSDYNPSIYGSKIFGHNIYENEHWYRIWDVPEDTTIENNATYRYSVRDVCLLGDTLVTVAGGSTKQIKDLEIGDRVLSLDLTTGNSVLRRVIFTDKDAEKSTSVWDEWVFDDGTIIKTAHRHEFYNVDAGKFKYLDEWKLGERAYKIDGTTPRLRRHDVHEEEVNHYKITLEGSTNYFANDLLTGDRECNKLDINI